MKLSKPAPAKDISKEETQVIAPVPKVEVVLPAPKLPNMAMDLPEHALTRSLITAYRHRLDSSCIVVPWDTWWKVKQETRLHSHAWTPSQLKQQESTLVHQMDAIMLPRVIDPGYLSLPDAKAEAVLFIVPALR